MLREQAVVWFADTFDGNGQPAYLAPVQINCRWDDVQEEFITPDMVRQMSSAVVYVDRDVPVGSMIRYGTLSELTSTTVPKSNTRTFEIRQLSKSPNFRHTEFLRRAMI